MYALQAKDYRKVFTKSPTRVTHSVEQLITIYGLSILETRAVLHKKVCPLKYSTKILTTFSIEYKNVIFEKFVKVSL